MLITMKYFLVAALALATAPQVAAGEPIKVAVVPGLAVNVDSARVDALCQDLAEALVSELVVEAAGGLEVRRQLHEGLPPDCVATPACTAGVSKATGASQLLFVVIVDSGTTGSVQVDTTWVDAATGHAASRPAIALTSTADSDAKAKFATYAKQLLPDAPVRPKPKLGITNLVGGRPRHVTRAQVLVASAGVVGLGVMVGFGLEAGSHYRACNADPNNCDKNERSTISNLALTSDIGLAVAASAAIATAILYATSAEAPHVAPMATPGGAGVSWTGRF